MKEEFFSLGLNEHRIWGYIFIPYIIKKSTEGNFYYTSHAIFPKSTDESFLSLTIPQQQIVRLSDEYSDQNLFKLFSREKNVKEFQGKVEPLKIEQHIRPYIEKRIASVFSILINNSTKVFSRDKSRSNIFEEDFLTPANESCEAVFSFEKLGEGTRYSLEIMKNQKKLNIKDISATILSDFPAILRINNSLLFIKDIEGKKIRPFFTRDFISVPASSEIKYYKSFILTTIRDFKVSSKGFEIKNIEVEKKVLLNLEGGLDNNAVLVLRFQYGKKIILANYKPACFVDFFKVKDDYFFEKIIRDPEFEENSHLLLKKFGYTSFDKANYELPGNRELGFETQLHLLVESLVNNHSEIKESGIIYSQDIRDKKFYLGNVSMNIKTGMENDWFDIHAVVNLDGFHIPFYKFKKHILNNIHEYILPDNMVFVLPEEWFSRYREVFEFGKTEGENIRIHKQHFFILEKNESFGNKSKLKNLDKLNRSESLPLAEVPKDLTTNLRKYQHEGFTWLLYLQSNNLGGCLADDMGLGKTVQAIALLLKNKENQKQQELIVHQDNQQLDLFGFPRVSLSSLIVVPASLVHNWVNEIRKFAPSLMVYTHVGNQRKKSSAEFQYFDIIISSYHTVRQDIELFSGKDFHYIILDESQVIKNPASKIYKAIETLKSHYKLALTGTPIENSLTDLWAQMNFVNSGLLGSLGFFKKEFTVPIEKKKQQEKEDKLKTLINPFILRRKKDEVALELPPISEQVIYCSMTEEQRKFYESEKSIIRNSIFEKIENLGVEKSSMIVLQGLTRLRQIANHPLLVDDEYTHESGKFNEVSRNIENIISEGHKVLIFSSFVKHLEIIEKHIKKEKIKYTLLTGKSIKREEIVRAFQNNPDCKVFLISLKAGGVGLNLTAADYVFILDPWWNPASESQAQNRAHRIGQDKNVFVYRFISENSIEEKIQILQERKSKLAATFIHSNNPMKAISRKDLEDLFE
jgi:SNF2 family DNA or RNA helicase